MVAALITWLRPTSLLGFGSPDARKEVAPSHTAPTFSSQPRVCSQLVHCKGAMNSALSDEASIEVLEHLLWSPEPNKASSQRPAGSLPCHGDSIYTGTAKAHTWPILSIHDQVWIQTIACGGPSIPDIIIANMSYRYASSHASINLLAEHRLQDIQVTQVTPGKVVVWLWVATRSCTSQRTPQLAHASRA